MKKKKKILLVVLIVLIVSCCLGIAYYKNRPKKTRGTPTIDEIYYSKDEYLNDYNKRLYNVYEGYSLVLREDSAIKDYPIKYHANITIRKSANPVSSIRQTFYVYNETLGYDPEAENDYQYSFKVTLVGYYFCIQTLDWFTRSYRRTENDGKVTYFINFALNNQDFGYYAIFYSSLDLPDEYCQKFLDDNFIVLNEE